MNNRLRLLAFACAAAVSGAAVAQSFTPGTLILGRVGNGAVAINGDGTGGMAALSIGKTVSTPTVVYTFPNAVGTASGTSFTVNGTSLAEGLMFRSPNGVLAVVGGYGASHSTPGSSVGGFVGPRRAAAIPFTGQLINNPNINVDSSSSTATLNGLAVRGAVSADGLNFWYATSTGLWYVPVGGAAVQVVATGVLRNVHIFGGNLYYNTQTQVFRVNGLPTAAGATTTQITGGGTPNLNAFTIVDSTTMLLVDEAGGTRRVILTGGATWDTVTTPQDTTPAANQMNATAARSIATDGHRVYVTNTSGNNNSLLGMAYVPTGTTTTTIIHTSGANFKHTGAALAPEPSFIAADTTAASGVTRFAMRTQGTATDPFIRAVRIANVNTATHGAAATIATVPYRGQIADMAVSSTGQTLLLNVIPNGTFNGWLYSLIRVSADGSTFDEGPITSGVPSAVAEAGFVPIQVDCHPTNPEASVLLWNPTTNTARIHVVNISGVPTVTGLNGPYTAGAAAVRARDIAYSSDGTAHILFSAFTAGTGDYDVQRVTGPTTNAGFATGSQPNLMGTSLAFDLTGAARILLTGAANGRPNQMSLVTAPNGSVAPSVVGTSYTLDSTTTNTVTSQPIWNQMWAQGVSWDNGAGTAMVYFAGSNGSLNATALGAEPRLNIPGSFRAWRMASGSNNVNLATYRFFPGLNLP